MLGNFFCLGDNEERDSGTAVGGGGSGGVRALLYDVLREYDKEVASLTAEVTSLKAQLQQQANRPFARPGGHQGGSFQRHTVFEGFCANDERLSQNSQVAEVLPDVSVKPTGDKLQDLEELGSEKEEQLGEGIGLAALTARHELSDGDRAGDPRRDNSSAPTLPLPKGGSPAATAENIASSTPARKRHGHGHGVQDLINKSEAAAGSAFHKFTARLETCIGAVIVINTLFLCIQLQVDGTRKGAILNSENVTSTPVTDTMMDAAEITFTTIFLLELILRLVMFRREFFWTPHGIEWLNLFDALLVCVTTLELVIFTLMFGNDNDINLTFLRMFRIVRWLRFLRIYRTIKLFKKLRMLVVTIASSVMAVFWSLVLLAIIMLGSAMFMVQALLPSLTDESISKSTRDWIFLYYGTTSRAYYSVFEFTFSGCWPSYARMLIDEVNAAWTLFFIAYIVSVSFTIFRIITAIFLRESMALLQNDAEMVAQEKLESKKQYALKLTDFFLAADANQDGVITADEFEGIVSHPEVRAWLAALDIEVVDIEEMFHAMDDGDGMISYDEFIKSVVYLKGTARASDLFQIKGNVKKVGRKLHELKHIVAQNQERSKENEHQLEVMNERLSLQDTVLAPAVSRSFQ